MRRGFFRMLTASSESTTHIPTEQDPRLVDGARRRQQRLAQLSPVQRAALVFERYPELQALPGCDWRRLSVHECFSVLFGASAQHYARLEVAALTGILRSVGCSEVKPAAGEARREQRSADAKVPPPSPTRRWC